MSTPYAAHQPYSKTLKPATQSPFAWLELAARYVRHRPYVLLLLPLLLFFLLPHYHKNPRVVIILAANEGGGVQRWKTPQEWSVERSSIANKREYAEQHGYILSIKDTALKRRYSHEWREGWEKADILKQTMRQYPEAEWFWWLDLHTFIMEPQISLEEYLFKNLENRTYRDLSYHNPLHIPVDSPYVDVEHAPVDLVLAQDCGGFNLGSFLVRRSEWTELLLDIWWDPVFYEQMHMTWEHKEQDCLETLYRTQPWIRERVGFVPLRAINSFPPGACAEQRDDPQYFYNEKDCDFLVNMAGCNFGDRSCWNEYEHYRNLQKQLRKSRRWSWLPGF
ncbi:hypothetical protein KL934_004544 [Ogataea polymorpha]|nr:hypothetical protein KL934_004544 [Ogataea polymorpha]